MKLNVKKFIRTFCVGDKNSLGLYLADLSILFGVLVLADYSKAIELKP
jgi:hypothetical protein